MPIVVAELPVAIVGDTFVVDVTGDAPMDGAAVVVSGESGVDDVCGVPAAGSAPLIVHKPFRQIMLLAGCTVTHPFARSNRAAPDPATDPAVAGTCQNLLTHVEPGSGAGDVHGT